MKTNIRPRSTLDCRHPVGQRGASLVVTLITALLIGIVLVGYLQLTMNNQRAVVRAEAWNAAIPVAEAGVEEALAHLTMNFPSNLVGQGWEPNDDGFIGRERDFGQGTYKVSFTPTVISTIYSTGYVRVHPNNALVSRTIRVQAMETNLVVRGLFAKDRIRMNGSPAQINSYDSTNPLFSGPGGVYDPTKARDGGDVGLGSDEPGAFDIGNAKIYGSVSTGPNSSVSTGPNASVGATTWVSGGSKGIEPGHFTDDCNGEMPDATAPFTTAAPPPGNVKIDNVTYNYVLGNGNYQVLQFGGKVLVNGHAVLLVSENGSMKFSGQDLIRITTNASLRLYVACAEASIAGQGVANESGLATSFSYYGLPSNLNLTITGNGELAGLIYAPSASVTLNGNGTVFGAIMAKEVTFNGGVNFHFDEALRRAPGIIKHFFVLSWDEI